ncbi:hypothetical protein [Vibrio natriegens]|uniref:hypothetical protein n=1 Tax=Vibrio natriegens TaxID=691 RepID=UPI003909376E
MSRCWSFVLLIFSFSSFSNTDLEDNNGSNTPEKSSSAYDVPTWLMNQQSDMLKRVSSLEENKASVERLHESELLSKEALVTIDSMETLITIFISLVSLLGLAGSFITYRKAINNAKDTVLNWLNEPENNVILDLKKEIHDKANKEIISALNKPEFWDNFQQNKFMDTEIDEAEEDVQSTSNAYNLAVLKFAQEEYDEVIKALDEISMSTSIASELSVKVSTLLAQTYFETGQADISKDIYMKLFSEIHINELQDHEKFALLKAKVNYARNLTSQMLTQESIDTLEPIYEISKAYPQLYVKLANILIYNYSKQNKHLKVVELYNSVKEFIDKLTHLQRYDLESDYVSLQVNAAASMAKIPQKMQEALVLFTNLASKYSNSSNKTLKNLSNKAKMGIQKTTSMY